MTYKKLHDEDDSDFIKQWERVLQGIRILLGLKKTNKNSASELMI
jgi:hypothetical protein